MDLIINESEFNQTLIIAKLTLKKIHPIVLEHFVVESDEPFNMQKLEIFSEPFCPFAANICSLSDW